MTHFGKRNTRMYFVRIGGQRQTITMKIRTLGTNKERHESTKETPPD